MISAVFKKTYNLTERVLPNHVNTELRKTMKTLVSERIAQGTLESVQGTIEGVDSGKGVSEYIVEAGALFVAFE